MEPNVRVEMLPEEKKRREEVLAKADRNKPGAAAALQKQFDKGKIQTFCAKGLLNNERIGKYPLISANYQHWVEDEQAWLAMCK
jgi:hypothetical protein